MSDKLQALKDSLRQIIAEAERQDSNEHTEFSEALIEEARKLLEEP